MGQRQVRESDTMGDGSGEEQVVSRAVVDAVGDARDGEREGSVRRPLIRATLKHPDGTPPPREPPLFTMHQQAVGDGRDAPQAGRRRGAQYRSFNDRRQAGGAPGNGRTFDNQDQSDGRSGPKPRSSRRGRGRSRQ